MKNLTLAKLSSLATSLIVLSLSSSSFGAATIVIQNNEPLELVFCSRSCANWRQAGTTLDNTANAFNLPPKKHSWVRL